MRNVLAAVAALALLPGCLSPRPDTSRYFTLPSSSATPAGGPGVASLGLGPIVLPPYVTRPEIASRTGPDEIRYAAGDRWAAPLDELVARSLADELRARVPARDVVRWPWPLQAPPEASVAVDFLRLEVDAAGGATLDARWTATVRGRPPLSGETRVKEPGQAGDTPASVAALGRALGRLSAEVATALRSGGG
jgi:uncharacterized lipoprotein YmbA